MSSVEHYRLALLQYIQYQQQLQAVLRLQEEIGELRTQISARHKKHRRCDKEIRKDFKVLLHLFSATNARSSMPLTLP